MTMVKTWLAAGVLAGSAFAAGWWFELPRQLGWSGTVKESHTQSAAMLNGVVQDNSGRQVLFWYDPMMPQQHFEQPGKSPFMDMELVAKYADEVSAGGVQISAGVLQNLGIRTGMVEREAYQRTARIPGEIRADERRQSMLHARADGFVESLLVRTEGEPVKKGQKLAEIYMPDILRAQAELLSLRSGEGLDALRESTRSRLRLLGVTDAEIKDIERRRKTTERVGIYAPQDGVVLRLGVREGSAVEPKDTLFEIVDLRQVWAVLEVPERQLALLDELERVDVTVAAYPGEVFPGRLDYVYPTVSTLTRTTPVRVILNNKDGRLKPGMYADAMIVTKPHLGRWVPTEAIIETGERKVVIVQADTGFRPAEVHTGPAVGDRTEILDGLAEGERVVISGQFLIDSEASLSGALARLASAPSAAQPMNAPAPMPDVASGEGILVDYDMMTGQVTLTHEPIPALNWPAMTMPFMLRNPHALHGAEPGARIRFTVKAQPENNQYLIETAEVVGGEGHD